MVKVTGPERATVDAPPEVLEPEKLPSELDSVQAVTFWETQNIVVRPPMFTFAGRAQILAAACGTLLIGVIAGAIGDPIEVVCDPPTPTPVPPPVAVIPVG